MCRLILNLIEKKNYITQRIITNNKLILLFDLFQVSDRLYFLRTNCKYFGTLILKFCEQLVLYTRAIFSLVGIIKTFAYITRDRADLASAIKKLLDIRLFGQAPNRTSIYRRSAAY